MLKICLSSMSLSEVSFGADRRRSIRLHFKQVHELKTQSWFHDAG